MGGVVGGVGWVGGPSHYVVTPTRVEVELRLGWALTIARNTIGMITHGRVVIMQNQHCSEATHIKQGIDKHSKTVVKLLALDTVQIKNHRKAVEGSARTLSSA